MNRRHFNHWMAGAFAAGGVSAAGQSLAAAATAAERRSQPMRLGVDSALARAGLASKVAKAFAHDTGLLVKTVTGPATLLLEALEQAELDATLTFAPAPEQHLLQQGLARDPHVVAQGMLCLVGPMSKGRDPLGQRGQRDAAAVMRRIAEQQAPMLGHSGGTSVHLMEQALWRAAGQSPKGAWFSTVAWPTALDAAEPDMLALARAQQRYLLLDRASWLAAGGAGSNGMGLIVESDPALVYRVQLLRAFRFDHPAGKLLGQWLNGATGRRVLASVPGLSAATS